MNTHNLKLPYISTTQAAPAITHNEALRMLDALVQPIVETAGLSSPPVDADAGTSYIVGPDASGEWIGKEAQIASFQDGAWEFHEPRTGWQAWIQDEEGFRLFDGAAWVARPIDASTLGVNSAADDENRLAVSSESSLFSHEDGDHRLKINKGDTADTASVVFQKGMSGRAEIGIVGDDSLRLKVSTNGSSWTEGLSIRGSDGKVSLPMGLVAPLAMADGGTGSNNPVAALSALGLRYPVGEIADDSVATINFGGTIFGSVIFLVGNSNLVPLGTVFARMAPSPQLVPLGIAGGTLGTYTTNLTGTTGTDGQVNMAALDGGVFKIENRRGFAISYTLYLLR